MANYEVSDEVARRTVVTLPMPSNGAELEKALVFAVGLVRERKSSTVYDDSVLVEADEDEIRLVIETQRWAVERK